MQTNEIHVGIDIGSRIHRAAIEREDRVRSCNATLLTMRQFRSSHNLKEGGLPSDLQERWEVDGRPRPL